MYEAKILKHSISPVGVTLVTFEVNYPHAVHKDIMTHRWARNFQSFRAIPPELLLEKLKAGEYFTPEVFGHRVKGMGQRNEPIQGQDAIDQKQAKQIWDAHVAESVAKAEIFLSPAFNIAKQQVNFLLQDLCFIRGIITTTLPQLDNFFHLRLDEDDDGNPVARPEVYKIAKLMWDAYIDSVPTLRKYGEWHLPLVTDEELSDRRWAYWLKVSVGRCARVSYLTHDGVRDPARDTALADSLLLNGHMSPFEHQGQPIINPWEDTTATGSFGKGWRQYRKFIAGEAVYRPRS